MKKTIKVESISLRMGAIVPPLKEQIPKSAGLSPDQIERFQKIADALVWVHLSGVIPESQVHKGREKLARKIGEQQIANAKARVK